MGVQVEVGLAIPSSMHTFYLLSTQDGPIANSTHTYAGSHQRYKIRVVQEHAVQTASPQQAVAVCV